MRNSGTTTVERRVCHGQDEVVLRINRYPAAVDIGDGRQTEHRNIRCGAVSRVIKEVEPNRHVDRRGGTGR